MELLTQLGLDQTYFIQVGIFLFFVMIFTFLVFPPYAEALRKREKSTQEDGGEGVQNLLKETSALIEVYETKTRDLNVHLKSIFDSYRAEAHQLQEQILSKAKREAQRLSEESKTKIQYEVQMAQVQLAQDVPALAQAIAEKWGSF